MSRTVARKESAPSSAPQGSVTSQALAMLRIVPQWPRPLATPIPNSEPHMTCVVETGKPNSRCQQDCEARPASHSRSKWHPRIDVGIQGHTILQLITQSRGGMDVRVHRRHVVRPTITQGVASPGPVAWTQEGGNFRARRHGVLTIGTVRVVVTEIKPLIEGCLIHERQAGNECRNWKKSPNQQLVVCALTSRWKTTMGRFVIDSETIRDAC